MTKRGTIGKSWPGNWRIHSAEAESKESEEIVPENSEEGPAILGAVAKVLGVYLTLPPPPDLQNPGQYPAVFAKTLNFAIFAHKSRRAL